MTVHRAPFGAPRPSLSVGAALAAVALVVVEVSRVARRGPVRVGGWAPNPRLRGPRGGPAGARVPRPVVRARVGGPFWKLFKKKSVESDLTLVRESIFLFFHIVKLSFAGQRTLRPTTQFQVGPVGI
jgi:hypothetical protein